MKSEDQTQIDPYSYSCNDLGGGLNNSNVCVYQCSPKWVLLDSGLEIELAFLFTTNYEPQYRPLTSTVQLDPALSYIRMDSLSIAANGRT
ncbi:hypothetical protein TNCV_1115201 [Trichonephila clavipes]|nr:hypothetical protein TNCV_1115201 [Trichonephila clavipes]